MVADELLERNHAVPARQFKRGRQIILGERQVGPDVLNRAVGQAFQIETIERVATIDTATRLITGLIDPQADAAPVLTARLAVASLEFIHRFSSVDENPRIRGRARTDPA